MKAAMASSHDPPQRSITPVKPSRQSGRLMQKQAAAESRKGDGTSEDPQVLEPEDVHDQYVIESDEEHDQSSELDEQLSIPELQRKNTATWAYSRIEDELHHVREKYLETRVRRTAELKLIKQLKATNRNLEKQIKQHLAEMTRLQHTLLEKERDFAKAEQQFYQKAQANQRTTIPDDEVRLAFDTIQRDILDWSDQWAVANIHWLNQVGLQDIIKYGTTDTSKSNMERLTQCFLQWKSSPRVLLATAIFHNLMGVLFQNPFFFVQELDWQDGLGSALLTVHHAIMCNGLPANPTANSGITDDEVKAHAWRSETMELLTKYLLKTNKDQKHKDVMLHAAQRLFLSVSQDASVLIKHVEPDQAKRRYDDFCEIAIRAMGLATRLWQQKTHMVLATDRAFEQPFSNDSPVHLAHGSMGLDEDDDTYNGREIDFLICPIVTAFGNSEGKEYNNEKIWSKALIKIFDLKKVVASDEVSLEFETIESVQENQSTSLKRQSTPSDDTSQPTKKPKLKADQTVLKIENGRFCLGRSTTGMSDLPEPGDQSKTPYELPPTNFSVQSGPVIEVDRKDHHDATQSENQHNTENDSNSAKVASSAGRLIDIAADEVAESEQKAT